MKIISTALAIIGATCLLSAAGNDELGQATGNPYPLAALIAWAAIGMACIGAAWAIYNLNTRKIEK